MENRTFSLPFDIELSIDNGVANIESELARELPTYDSMVETARVVGVIEGIEHLLVALAHAGLDLGQPQYADAIRACIAGLQE